MIISDEKEVIILFLNAAVCQSGPWYTCAGPLARGITAPLARPTFIPLARGIQVPLIKLSRYPLQGLPGHLPKAGTGTLPQPGMLPCGSGWGNFLPFCSWASHISLPPMYSTSFYAISSCDVKYSLILP